MSEMWADYIALPEVQFIIEHYPIGIVLVVVGTFVAFVALGIWGDVKERRRPR